MPTGYTADVGDGKVTDFATFALTCARAFGALIEMRDEPMDAPISEAFKPRRYYSDALAQVTAELADLDGLTSETAESRAAAAYDVAMEQWQDGKAKREAMRLRYQAMLEQARVWRPPTADHDELRRFMMQQLQQSIDFDCNHDDEQWIPKRKTGAQWLTERRQDLTERQARYREEDEKERTRALERTAWVKALRDSLAVPPPTGRE